MMECNTKRNLGQMPDAGVVAYDDFAFSVHKDRYNDLMDKGIPVKICYKDVFR